MPTSETVLQETQIIHCGNFDCKELITGFRLTKLNKITDPKKSYSKWRFCHLCSNHRMHLVDKIACWYCGYEVERMEVKKNVCRSCRLSIINRGNKRRGFNYRKAKKYHCVGCNKLLTRMKWKRTWCSSLCKKKNFYQYYQKSKAQFISAINICISQDTRILGKNILR